MLQNKNVLAFIFQCILQMMDQRSTITTSHRVSANVSAFQWVDGINHSKFSLSTKLTFIVWPLGNLKNLITLTAYCDYPGVPFSWDQEEWSMDSVTFNLRINTWKLYLLLKIEERGQWATIGKACIWFTKFIKERMSTCFKLQNEKRISLIDLEIHCSINKETMCELSDGSKSVKTTHMWEHKKDHRNGHPEWRHANCATGTVV